MIAESRAIGPQLDARLESVPRALALLLLYVVSQCAALRLIDVAPYGVFQHYVEWSNLRQTPAALALLIVQTGVCLWVAAQESGRVLLAPVNLTGWLRLAVVVVVLAFSLAIPTASVTRSLGEILMAAWIALVAVLNLVLVARTVPVRVLAGVRDWVSCRITMQPSLDEPRPWDGRLPWFVAVLVAVMCGVLSWFVFDGVPHVDDSVAYYFQAKTLALGQVQVPAPPDPDSFGVTHLVIRGPNWFSKFFPGWPALLSVGVLAGVPWLVNPVLGAVAILLAHRLVMRLHDRGTANATILLLAASPWLLGTSSEMMSHAAALVWALLALLAIEYQRGRPVGIWSVVAGFALGALYLTRPFDAALLGATAALWAWGAGGSRLSLGALATIFVVSLGIAATMFPYNAALTGSASIPPFRLWADHLFGPGVDVFGFGPNVGIPMWRNIDPLPGHAIPDVVLNANKNFTLMNFELFGWATGSLLLAILACLLGPWRRADAIFFGVPFVVIFGHSFYWAPGGPDFGARYWYLLIVPLTVLTVRGAQMVQRRLSTTTAASLPGSRVGIAIFIASAAAMMSVLPWRSVTKYHRYRDIGGDVRALARGNDWNEALVFVRSPFRADYQAAFNFLSPRLGAGGPVFAFDAGPGHREAVVRRFPDRPIWIIGPADETHAGHLVVKSGPLPAGVAPAGASFPYDRVLQVVLPGIP